MPDKSTPDNKYKLFAVGALGTLMATFEGSILNVALPTISDELDVSIDTVAWVVLAYTLTVISLMLVFGAWTQRKGYAFSYMFGYAFFVSGSLVCALSGDIYMLVFGRVVQATGSAMFAALGPALVTTVFPREERGKGLGIMVMMVSAGFMAGPPVGGLMLSIWPWNSIFLLVIPFGVVGIVLARRYFPSLPPEGERRRVVLLGPILMSASLVTAVYGLTGVSYAAVSEPRVWGFLVVSAVCLIAFLVFESKPDRALIGLAIFRNRRFVTSIAAQLTMFVAFSGVMVLVPFFLERVKGLEPREVGLYLVIMPIMMFIFSPLAGKLSDRIGFRLLTSFGMAIIGLGLYLMTSLDLATEGWYIVMALALLGAGAGVFGSPNTSALMGSVLPEQRPVASAILATNRNIGMSVGVALATASFAYYQTQNAALADDRAIFVASYQPVVLLAMGAATIGLIVCLTRGGRSSQGIH